MIKIENFTIHYDNNEEEIEIAFRQFQHKYTLRRKILFTIVYAIASGLGLDLMIKNNTNMIGYILFVLPLAMIFIQWMRPYFVRKRLIKTLSSFSRETYTATFSSDRIEIETDIVPEEMTETVAVTAVGVMSVADDFEVPENTEVKAEKTVLELSSTVLDSLENDKMFMLFVNRSLIYAFPKRCLGEDQITALKAYFDDKNI